MTLQRRGSACERHEKSQHGRSEFQTVSREMMKASLQSLQFTSCVEQQNRKRPLVLFQFEAL